jgi:hypothetical protein
MQGTVFLFLDMLSLHRQTMKNSKQERGQGKTHVLEAAGNLIDFPFAQEGNGFRRSFEYACTPTSTCVTARLNARPNGMHART